MYNIVHICNLFAVSKLHTSIAVLFADNLTKDLVGVNMVKGLDPGTFRDLVSRMVQQRAAIQNVYEVVGAVEFEYTYWAKPDNESAVRQNLIDVSMYVVYMSALVYM